MRKFVLFGGLPRSGTTYTYLMVCKALDLKTFGPEETAFFSDAGMFDAVEEFADLLYRENLIDKGVGNKTYSAWGSKEFFRSEFFALLVPVIGALCRRVYLEGASIRPDYVEAIESLRSNTLDHLIKDARITLKRPLLELLAPRINDVLSEADVRYVINIRDPYDVYCSLMQLGWFSSYDMFVETACSSYERTLELLNAKQAVVIDAVSGKYDDEYNIDKVAALIGVESPPPGSLPASTFKNAVSKSKQFTSRKDFNFKFHRTEASKLYQTLLKLL